MEEMGRSVSEVRRFGGASRVYPGISCGFHGLGLALGELAEFMTLEGDLTGGPDVFVTVDNVASLRGGVGARGVGLVVDEDGLLVGVEDLAVDLDVGVEDLAGTVGLGEDKTGREVGVEDLVGLDVVVEVVLLLETRFDMALDCVPKDGLLVGVEGLEPDPEPEPPEEDDLRCPALGPGDAARGLDANIFLPLASGWVFDNLDFSVLG